MEQEKLKLMEITEEEYEQMKSFDYNKELIEENNNGEDNGE